jgi:pimeloyl-ACP methyl ester carboxylesterase
VTVARSLEAGSVHIVGFSTAIALRAALREPGLVRSLTIVEPNVPWLLEGTPEGGVILGWWRAENARVRAEAHGDSEREAALWFDLVNNRGPGAFDDQSGAFRAMWLENFTASRPKAPPPEPLSCERLRAISAPTLAVTTEFGMPYSRAIVERLVDCIPASRLVDVPTATHFVSYQDPDVFNRLMLDFIAQH